MNFIKFYVLVGILAISKARTKFMPNLPLGEYRIITSTIHQCPEEPKSLPMKFNLFLSKKSSNITEIRGNITYEIPFDDTLILDVNIASWSLTGEWKPNSLVYVTKNACSKYKTIMGNAWYSFTKTFNVPTVNCPQPKGIYMSSGFDTSLLNDNNYFDGQTYVMF